MRSKKQILKQLTRTEDAGRRRSRSTQRPVKLTGVPADDGRRVLFQTVETLGRQEFMVEISRNERKFFIVAVDLLQGRP